MATTQGYQQVVVVPTVVPQSQTRSDFLRRGVRIGGLAIGLPCVICLSVAGFIFVISSISILSVDSMFDDFDSHFDDDFDSPFDDQPLNAVGIIMLLIGIGLIIASIVLCCVGHREYQKFTQGNAGRVINTNPTVPASSFQLTSSSYSPNIAPYSSPGVQQATYQPPVGGQVAPQMMYPGGPTSGQMQYPGAPPAGQMPYPAAPAAGQMSYPAAPTSGQMHYPAATYPAPTYPSPTSAGQMPYPSGKAPYPAAVTPTGPTVAQVPPYTGQQQYVTNPPYQAQAPDFQEPVPGLPSKGGVPGEVAPEYDRPPAYAP